MHPTLNSILQSLILEKLCAAILTFVIGLIGYGLVRLSQTKPGMICCSILRIVLMVAVFPFLLAMHGGFSGRCRRCGACRPWECD
jgi:hypothetical protein